jgi:outer membrane lipoprotein LolB
MRRALTMLCCAVMAACATQRAAPPALNWQQRVNDLQHAGAWQLDGRAAVAFGAQGWQATLNWRQAGSYAEVNLAGPFGIGALMLRQEPGGLSMNGAPPSDAVLAQVQERLGFELPIDHLRFWLLGVPDPDSTFDVTSNEQDRAGQLTQAGWTILYDRYAQVTSDLLPSRLSLSRGNVRVRIVIDRWTWPR